MLTLYSLKQNTLKLHNFLDKNDVKLALMHVYNIDSYTDYVLKLHTLIEEKQEFYAIINRLVKGEPIQYILGKAYFYDRYFFVNKNVLIPRVETEELVDIVLKDVKENTGNLLDLGTGSGAIALTLKAHSKLSVFASDISKKALEVAQKNDCENSVTFVHGDLLAPFINKEIAFDYIVANLPYIKREEEVEQKVKDYEPESALYNSDPNIFERLFKEVKMLNFPKTGLSIYLEIGTNQDYEVSNLARRYLGENVKINVVNDMHGKKRFVIIKDIYGN